MWSNFTNDLIAYCFWICLTHTKLQVPTVNKYDFTQNDKVSIFNSLKGSHELAASG